MHRITYLYLYPYRYMYIIWLGWIRVGARTQRWALTKKKKKDRAYYKTFWYIFMAQVKVHCSMYVTVHYVTFYAASSKLDFNPRKIRFFFLSENLLHNRELRKHFSCQHISFTSSNFYSSISEFSRG